MRFFYTFIILIFFSNFLNANEDTLKYSADLQYYQNNYSKAIDFYYSYGVKSLNSRRVAKLIESLYIDSGEKKSTILKITELVDIWVKKGVRPDYIQGILLYKFTKINQDFINELFELNIKHWNDLYGLTVGRNPNEFYNCSKFYIKDQHLRFLEIETRKKVDKETFLRADSVNLSSIRDFLVNNELEFDQNINNIFFGVIHHYCAEHFFTADDFNFFDKQLKKYVNKGLIDIKDYCYFIDKYLIFNGKRQMYGTYSEMEGVVGVSSDMYEKFNRNRFEIGYLITIEDQIKYQI